MEINPTNQTNPNPNPNLIERIKMVKALEFIARQVNDEIVFEEWLINGVADGDIPYGATSVEIDDVEELACYYEDDKCFAELMQTFLVLMSEALNDGGLYCDKVVSK